VRRFHCSTRHTRHHLGNNHLPNRTVNTRRTTTKENCSLGVRKKEKLMCFFLPK